MELPVRKAGAIVIFLCLYGLVLAQNDGDKPSIADVVGQTIASDGVQAAIAQYHKLKTNEAQNYNFAESELNRLGYSLISQKKYTEAIAIFKLNLEAYPKSPNCYDSLAEAYLRAGKHQKAETYYSKVLEMLPTAKVNEQTRDFLKKNAAARLAYLNNPDRQRPSTVINNFLNRAEEPFGKLNPKAPSETRQFGQLAGMWQCTQHALVNGQWYSGWPATWVWKYILDSFAVQDLWLQEELDLPPTMANLGRDYVGTNVRIYDPALEKWRVAWFQNNPATAGKPNAMSTFEAEFKDGKIIMMPTQQSTPMTRIVFHNITEDSFDWRNEVSEDEGQTWAPRFKITAKRIK